jgi:ubiquinone/menaquinone biosynthesis C-methylase UbiE
MNDEFAMRSHLQRSAFSVQRSVVRWAFTRFYREFAWTYDAVAAAVSGGRWAEWGRTSLPELRGQVLEIGCGTGNLQRSLQQSTSHWAVGLDTSLYMLAITRRKLTRAALPIHLTRGVAQALPFAPNSFDSIVATFPTDYILDSATLAEIWRVLRPNGRLVVVLAATFGRSGLYQQAIGLLYRITLQRSPATPPGIFRRSILARRLAELGLAVTERWEPVGGNQVQLVVAERV